MMPSMLLSKIMFLDAAMEVKLDRCKDTGDGGGGRDNERESPQRIEKGFVWNAGFFRR